jgi:putative hydrolase of HD superfamily
MEQREFLDILHIAERLKDAERHCTTTNGRRESVAEHSWRISLMAFLLEDVFPEADINKVIRMCLIHDLGECFTGDIPTFLKTDQDRRTEDELLNDWVASLSEDVSVRMSELYKEMEAQQTVEAKIYKALDKLEALIQHNESPISTWADNEYELNRTYAFDTVEFSPWLKELRQEILQDTLEKIRQEAPDRKDEGERI